MDRQHPLLLLFRNEHGGRRLGMIATPNDEVRMACHHRQQRQLSLDVCTEKQIVLGCRAKIFSSGGNVGSGVYFIDPDGQGL